LPQNTKFSISTGVNDDSSLISESYSNLAVEFRI